MTDKKSEGQTRKETEGIRKRKSEIKEMRKKRGEIVRSNKR